MQLKQEAAASALNQALQQPLSGGAGGTGGTRGNVSGGGGVISGGGISGGEVRGIATSNSGIVGIASGGDISHPMDAVTKGAVSPLSPLSPLSRAIAAAEEVGVVVTEARGWLGALEQDRSRMERVKGG